MQGSAMTIAKPLNPDIKIQIHIFLSPYIFCRTNERIREFAKVSIKFIFLCDNVSIFCDHLFSKA